MQLVGVTGTQYKPFQQSEWFRVTAVSMHFLLCCKLLHSELTAFFFFSKVSINSGNCAEKHQNQN